MQARVPATKEGQAQWEKLVRFIETPPPGAFRDRRVRDVAASSFDTFAAAAEHHEK